MPCPGRLHTARREQGYSLPELLVVLALIGLSLGASAAAWQSYRRSTAVTTAVATLKMRIDEARLLSVYRVVEHFVVLDPTARTLRVVEDSGPTPGVYESTDPVLSTSAWPKEVQMALPTAPSPLPSPIGGGTVAAAWALPVPTAGGAWTSGLRGVALTAEGRILSAEATPQVIGFGSIVFRDTNEGTRAAAIGLEGGSGTVRAYRLDAQGQWVGL